MLLLVLSLVQSFKRITFVILVREAIDMTFTKNVKVSRDSLLIISIGELLYQRHRYHEILPYHMKRFLIIFGTWKYSNKGFYNRQNQDFFKEKTCFQSF